MSHERRSTLEKHVQAEIEAALGADPDLLLFKNSVGKARHITDDKTFFVPYGLGVGSPDLVGLLRISIPLEGRWEGDIHVPRTAAFAMWFCLEVKPPEGELDPEQVKCHAIWRSFGAFIETVRSVPDARAALERARRLELSR